MSRSEPASPSPWDSSPTIPYLDLEAPLFPRAFDRIRQPSVTPSSTSVSEGEDDDLSLSLGPEDMQSWITGGVKGKGKERASDSGSGSSSIGGGLAGTLPPEILLQIFRQLPSVRDLQSTLLVSRSWCLSSFSLLWSRPMLYSPSQLAAFLRVIIAKDPSLPYAASVRRITLASMTDVLTDDLFLPLEKCTRMERLTLAGATHLSSRAMRQVLKGMSDLMAIDLSMSKSQEDTAVRGVNDDVLATIAKSCTRLQGLNLSGCRVVGDDGILQIAECTRNLRRIKIPNCNFVTDRSLVKLTQNCPLLLEMDLADVPQLSNAAAYSIFLHSAHLRELRFNGNTNLTDDGFPDLPYLASLTGEEAARAVGDLPWFASTPMPTPTLLRPVAETFDQLRSVDLTGCAQIGDLAIEHLVSNAPKLRTLTLAKCPLLTDNALESIERLGKHLHYLHLGHVALITDAAVTRLARSCTRMRYVDFACCPLLSDLSVFELAANLPKLRRIGLVKVVNLTDEGIYALVERHSSLERIHLSYCENVTVKAITFMLNRLVHLTHLSLTGITAFKTPELQQFCRPPPTDFNEHQQSSFCVYSGHGVQSLRNYLNTKLALEVQASSDGNSTPTRRGSESSESSFTIPPTYDQNLISRRTSLPILEPTSHFGQERTRPLGPRVRTGNGAGLDEGDRPIERRYSLASRLAGLVRWGSASGSGSNGEENRRP
ncbi:F-box and leucine-rich repeat protein GRR1, partial [Tremellales sp. Uapishka_1]